jgi:hypothetical protein
MGGSVSTMGHTYVVRYILYYIIQGATPSIVQKTLCVFIPVVPGQTPLIGKNSAQNARVQYHIVLYSTGGHTYVKQ